MSKNNKEPLFDINDLSNYRIITKDLVYVIGLSEKIAIKETLMQHEYFGQYGLIIKLIINKKTAYNQHCQYGPSYSAFVTYSKPSEASIAILSLDNTYVDNHPIRASFGTTKYCVYFLKNMPCNNKHCLFLHAKASDSDIIKRDDLSQSQNQTIFIDQQLYAIKIADIYNPDVKKRLLGMNKRKTVFNSPDLLYQSEIVIDNDPKNRLCNNTTSYEDNNSNDNRKNKNVLQSHSFNENSKISLLDTDLRRSYKSKDDNMTSVSTASDETKKSSLNQIFQVPKVFEAKDTSRFDFFQSEECNCDGDGDNGDTDGNGDGDEIPSFIQHIINKSTKVLPFTKNIKNNHNDTFVYLDLLSKDKLTSMNNSSTNQWMEFLTNNTKNPLLLNHPMNKHEDEFIDDIEKINNFILNKTIYL